VAVLIQILPLPLAFDSSQEVVTRRLGSARKEMRTFGEDATRSSVDNNPNSEFGKLCAELNAGKAATTTIPIVGSTSDPVANGMVPSLARSGSNIIGVSSDASLEILGKRLELLREGRPRRVRVGFLASRKLWELAEAAVMREAAERVQISLIGPPLDEPLQQAEYRRVIAAMTHAGAEALLVVSQPKTSRTSG
jgi:putative tryptophan/tyrosine transport system substrate-binding protein